MNTRSKLVAAALGLLVVTGAAADASAATLTRTKTVAVHRTMRPAVKKMVIVHRFHRPLRAHFAGLRVLAGHRNAPRIHVAHAVTKKIVKTTVIR